MRKTKEHKVAQIGSGYCCLDTGALWFTSVANILSGDKLKEALKEWTKSHKVKHRLATAKEVAAFDAGRRVS